MNDRRRQLTARLIASVLFIQFLSPIKGASGDLEERLTRAPWLWKAERASALYSATQVTSSYEIVLLVGHRLRKNVTISVLEKGKTLFSWDGYAESVFAIIGTRLFYADFDPHVTGGAIRAVDLTTGQELWNSRLRAIPPAAHSLYSNSMVMDVSDQMIIIYGYESRGRYIELKDLRTGDTLAHRVLTKEQAPAVKAGE